MNDNSVRGDRAIQNSNQDKLGFREIASRIAIALVDHASDGGLVVGVEGAWGSGKSSLLFLIEDELGRLKPSERPTVIQFRPWLVGNRDALLSDLFASLRKEIDQIASTSGALSQRSMIKAKAAAKALRKFALGLGVAGAAAEKVGEVVGFAPLRYAGLGIKTVQEWLSKPKAPSLEALKDDLIVSLRDLGHRFIVTVDDVDRLDPSEVIEVLRLTRSVADFPNVVYVLCYDAEILAQGIEQAAKVQSGRAYLEKIVQLTVMVPKPEALQLRQWFSEELANIASTKNDDELSRLKAVIDCEGGVQLRSPRSVVRALDSLRFFWPPLHAEKADLADVVWLQLIKDGNPKLYRWIEDYCADAAVLSLGAARVEDAQRENDLATLYASVKPGYFDDKMYCHQFAEQLSGLEIEYVSDGVRFNLHQKQRDEVRDSAIRNARLASPDHYKLYFALRGPSFALVRQDYADFESAAGTSSEQTEELILRLHSERVAGELGKADLLLERIKGGGHELLTALQCANLLIAFSNSLDNAHRIRAFERFFATSLWDRAERLTPILLVRCENRKSVLEKMFQGRAIGWLTGIFRSETYAHGRYGARPEPEDRWLFSDLELDWIKEVMIARYRSMSIEEVLKSVHPAALLFAWQQGGDGEGPRQLIERHIETDEGLIETLECLTGKVNSSDRGEFRVLRREGLAHLLDYATARERIEKLRLGGALEARAQHLADAFRDGNDY